ncbi:MAG: hypothetical protein AAB400_03460, partial [Patescibacteria group bacterium]
FLLSERKVFGRSARILSIHLQRFKYKKMKGEMGGVLYSNYAESPLGSWGWEIRFQRQDFF